MELPLSTGDAARLLGVTEPQLAEAVRRGKVNPAPRVLAGRRLWDRHHLVQAAESLKLLDDAGVREALGLDALRRQPTYQPRSPR